MERDDSQSTAGLQMINRGLHALPDCAEFVVDGNADGLKAALGRMLLFTQRLVRHGAADDVDKLERRLDRVILPHAVDGRGD